MSKKKADAFTAEQDVLKEARQALNNTGSERQTLADSFSVLCDEYEKLLEEAKFLTKVSDKLESKLNKANEELVSKNENLTTEVESKESQLGQTLLTNKNLRKEKSALDDKQNQLQMTLIIIIAVLLIAMVVFIWLFFKMSGDVDSLTKSNEDKKAKIEQMAKDIDAANASNKANSKDEKAKQPKEE